MRCDKKKKILCYHYESCSMAADCPRVLSGIRKGLKKQKYEEERRKRL